jgi:hypothetical protein
MAYKIETRGISSEGKEYRNLEFSNKKDYGRAISSVNSYKILNKEKKVVDKEKKKAKKKYQKFFHKPKVKIQSYSAENLIKKLGKEQGSIVREIEEPEIKQDNRSLFFKEEFRNEVNKNKSWLLS